MDTFESLLADIIEHARMNRTRDTSAEALAMTLAKEYREDIRVSLARTFAERAENEADRQHDIENYQDYRRKAP